MKGHCTFGERVLVTFPSLITNCNRNASAGRADPHRVITITDFSIFR